MGLLDFGAKLIEGILGRNSEKDAIRRQNEYNSPAAIRRRAEAAGFNPLLFVGPGVGLQTATGGSNYMGQAIAEAGLMAADQLSARQAATKLEQARAENRRLQQQLTKATIRPKVDGIYARPEMVPSRSSALGGVGGKASGVAGGVGGAGASAGLVPSLDRADPLDPRRKVAPVDIPSEAGWTIWEMPGGYRVRVPSFNGEIPGWDQALMIGGSWLFQKGQDAAAKWSANAHLNRQYNAVTAERQRVQRSRVRLEPPSGLFTPNGGHW